MSQSVRVLFLGGSEADAARLRQGLRRLRRGATVQLAGKLTDLSRLLRMREWRLVFADFTAYRQRVRPLVRRIGADQPGAGLVLLGRRISASAALAAIRAGARDAFQWSDLDECLPACLNRPQPVLASHDTYHHRKVEQALRESEERHRKLVEMSPDAIYIHRRGRIEFINPAGLRLFRADHPDQIIGRQMLDLIHPDFRPVVAERIRAINEHRKPAPLLAQKILRLDGSVGDTEAAATFFTYDGEPAALVVARDISDRKQAEQVLLERASLRELSQRILQSQEEERRHLSRELHDEAGQALTAIKLNTEMLARRVPEHLPVLRQLARDTAEVAAGLIAELRRIAAALRPAMLEDLGLLPALRWHIKGVETRYGLRVKLISRGLKSRLNPSFETAIYRIVQEALTNVVRHARALHASVRVTYADGRLDLLISDDGQGMDPARVRQGTGLTGIRERAGLHGGTLLLESQAGQGTVLRVEFRDVPENAT